MASFPASALTFLCAAAELNFVLSRFQILVFGDAYDPDELWDIVYDPIPSAASIEELALLRCVVEHCKDQAGSLMQFAHARMLNAEGTRYYPKWRDDYNGYLQDWTAASIRSEELHLRIDHFEEDRSG